MDEPRRDYYAVLGVAHDASDAVIKSAFRALAKQYHPDSAGAGDAEATAKFIELQDAYKVLSNAESRASYDQEINVGEREEYTPPDGDQAEAHIDPDEAWGKVEGNFPEINAIHARFSLYSAALANHFRLAVISGDYGEDPNSFASSIETAFFTKYFGNDPEVHAVAKRLLIKQKRAATKELNKAVKSGLLDDEVVRKGFLRSLRAEHGLGKSPPAEADKRNPDERSATSVNDPGEEKGPGDLGGSSVDQPPQRRSKSFANYAAASLAVTSLLAVGIIVLLAANIPKPGKTAIGDQDTTRVVKDTSRVPQESGSNPISSQELPHTTEVEQLASSEEIVPERALADESAYPQILSDGLPYGDGKTVVLDADFDKAPLTEENKTVLTKQTSEGTENNQTNNSDVALEELGLSKPWKSCLGSDPAEVTMGCTRIIVSGNSLPQSFLTEAYFRRALAFEKRYPDRIINESTDGAILDYKSAIKLTGVHGLSNLELAKVYDRIGNAQLSLHHLELALSQLSPEDIEAHGVRKLHQEVSARTASTSRQRLKISELESILATIETPKPVLATIDASEPDSGQSASTGKQPIDSETITRLMTRIKECWVVPPGAVEKKIVVRVLANLSRDGKLTGTPQVLNGTNDAVFEATARAAVAAFIACEPYDFLPISSYEAWKSLIINFNAELVGSLTNKATADQMQDNPQLEAANEKAKQDSAGSAPAVGTKRIALVIGNSKYQNVSPLKNPDEDAELMARTLEGLGFTVSKVLDADQAKMKRAMLEFGRASRAGAELSLFYFSGHGVQLDSDNYLLPVDASLKNEEEVAFQGIEINAFLQTLDDLPGTAKVVVLDACRNNPFTSRFRGMSRGLAPVVAQGGTYIAYSTSPGSVADDGDDENSPYTAALARSMAKPGLKIEEVFKLTRAEVMKASGNRQVPWESSSLLGDVYFIPKQ